MHHGIFHVENGIVCTVRAYLLSSAHSLQKTRRISILVSMERDGCSIEPSLLSVRLNSSRW